MDKSEIMLTEDTRRVAIIGCGNIAGEVDEDIKKRHIYGHAKAISFIKNIKITACCDSDTERVQEFATKWKIPAQYRDVRELLDKEHVDIMVVATPTKNHLEHVQLALDSNVKVIFCEKPLSFDLESGHTLVKKARELNKLLVLNYMRRWDPFYAECKSIVKSGELGRIETIVAYVDTALYMNSIHMMDMLVYFGGDVSSCVGHIDRTNETRIVHGEKDFGGIALFKHKNGVISFLKATGATRRNHFFELDIQCTKGRLRILDDDTKYEVYRFKESPQHKGLVELSLVESKSNSCKQERLVEAYLDILNFIETKKEPAFSAQESLRSLELIQLMYQSDAADGQPAYSQL
ncbi:MAG: Gfo/Idh/MocA family oxidoreductase [Candidatus Brocadiaceae bacterium]|nr:Gfo/Idh/MocA family oxidoreductase [Candidatus Brocadiaceae bacterium]